MGVRPSRQDLERSCARSSPPSSTSTRSDWKSYERVKKFIIADEEFTTANDMLTPTLKVKRRNVIKRYGADLDKLYS